MFRGIVRSSHVNSASAIQLAGQGRMYFTIAQVVCASTCEQCNQYSKLYGGSLWKLSELPTYFAFMKRRQSFSKGDKVKAKVVRRRTTYPHVYSFNSNLNRKHGKQRYQ
jgi:hypothetical protein